MSIVSKQNFLEEIEESLADKLTVSQIQSVLDVINENMFHYDVERIFADETKQEFDEMLDLYIDAKEVSGLSAKTITRYIYILNKLKAACSTPIRHMTAFDIRRYLMTERERGISDRTLDGYRQIFSSFFGWLAREGLIPINPCGNISSIKCKQEVRLPLSDVDIERLKEYCKCTRDKTIICFLLSTGCRISEVCALNRDDVDLHNKECKVLGKGNKERRVYIDDITAMLLERYFRERTDSNEALFIGKGNVRLHPGGVRKLLHELGDDAGVEDVHPHRFRRTLATNLINHGMSIQEVATILGHSKIDTTMQYIYINDDSVKNAYRRYA